MFEDKEMELTQSRSCQSLEALESMVHQNLTFLDEPFPKHPKVVIISTSIQFIC